MAKRFIDTNLFNDEWFCELSKDGKLYFIYFITNCDHAGILKINKKLFEFQTGIKSWATVHEELANCYLTLKDGVYFMPKFIKFQYPNFPQSNVNQQQGALKILESYGIDLTKIQEFIKSSSRVHQELSNSYDSDSVNVLIKDSAFNFKKSLMLKNADAELVDAWMQIRKNKKATNSEKAFKMFISEVEKSKLTINEVLEICVKKDWKGFDCSWLKDGDIKPKEDDIKYLITLPYKQLTAEQFERVKKYKTEQFFKGQS